MEEGWDRAGMIAQLTRLALTNGTLVAPVAVTAANYNGVVFLSSRSGTTRGDAASVGRSARAVPSSEWATSASALPVPSSRRRMP